MQRTPVSKQTAAGWMAIFAVLALGCGGGSATESAAGQGPAVSVSPHTATVYPEQTLAFQATVTGYADTSVTWSVVEGAAGGTITPTGVYTAPSTTGTYRISAVSAANPSMSGSATVTVSTAPPPPPTGSAMTTAHRTSGVAPLAVFFDAVDTNTPSDPLSPFVWRSGVYQPADYEGTYYTWNFGDPGAGSWSTTGGSRNTATGYTAAHVYETPGTYTATLTVTDSSGVSRTYTQTITVTGFSGTTYFVAANGSDSNNGTSEATPFQSVDHAMSRAIATTGPVRVLFRRGDAFTTAGQWNITKPGPGIIGAYGAGNRPVINSRYTGDLNVFSPQGAGRDWRIMDLQMVGAGTGYAGPVGPPVGNQAVDTLMMRIFLSSGWDVGLGWGEWQLGASPHDAQFVVECEAAGAYRNGMYVGGHRLALLGNNIHDTTISHLLRIWQAHKAVVSNNRLWNPGGGRSALKLHSTDRNDPRPETRFVTISDNLIRGTTWAVGIGLQGGPEDERPNHIVVERNRFYGEPSINAHLMIHSSEVMVRNNVFDATGSASETGCVWVTHEPTVPIENHVRVFNNTMIRNDASSRFFPVMIDSGITNVIVENNLAAHGGAGEATLVDTSGGVMGRSGGAGAGFVQSNNAFVPLSQFTNASGGDFSLTAGSSAVDAGMNLSSAVGGDFLRAARPRGAAYDLGAYESH